MHISFNWSMAKACVGRSWSELWCHRDRGLCFRGPGLACCDGVGCLICDGAAAGRAAGILWAQSRACTWYEARDEQAGSVASEVLHLAAMDDLLAGAGSSQCL